LPQEEICDNFDNDCNGLIDDTLSRREIERDIFFIVDASCSMDGENYKRHINGIISFVRNFVDTEKSYYGLIFIGADSPRPAIYWACPSIRGGVCRKEQMIQALLMNLTISLGSTELSYDAIMDAVLLHDWKTFKRHMFIFADEHAQSLRVGSPQQGKEFLDFETMKEYLNNLLIRYNISTTVWTAAYNEKWYNFSNNTDFYHVWNTNIDTYTKLTEKFPIVCE
jgi:hypothetical protein